MSLQVGIVGLPNVGKSCIFNALTQAGARVENFPFCTVDPNHGIVPLPDRRLDELVALLSPPKVTPATLEVVDIAGLVEGAHRGEGLGNQFLGNLREVDALLHVLRCFGGEVTHVAGEIDPLQDLEIVDLELQLADLGVVERRLDKIAHEAQVGVKEARAQQAPMGRFAEALRAGTPLRQLQLDGSDTQMARHLGTQIGQLDDVEERAIFLADLGLQEPGLDRLARHAYGLLGLITFYTFVGGKELRAWSVPKNSPAPKAAGAIHTDFERGFIRAEVLSFEDFVS
jgi:ribosome-binding ATPase YchF (GTP1/OBG family)